MICCKLSYSFYLLIGLCCFVSQPVDYSKWFAAKSQVQAFVVEVFDPLPDACFRL